VTFAARDLLREGGRGKDAVKLNGVSEGLL
jgi:hypothetical protein